MLSTLNLKSKFFILGPETPSLSKLQAEIAAMFPDNFIARTKHETAPGVNRAIALEIFE